MPDYRPSLSRRIGERRLAENAERGSASTAGKKAYRAMPGGGCAIRAIHSHRLTQILRRLRPPRRAGFQASREFSGRSRVYPQAFRRNAPGGFCSSVSIPLHARHVRGVNVIHTGPIFVRVSNFSNDSSSSGWFEREVSAITSASSAAMESMMSLNCSNTCGRSCAVILRDGCWDGRNASTPHVR